MVSLSRPFRYNGLKRWYLNFDGVGIRGVFNTKAINVDGDIDIEFMSPSVLGPRQTILSQQVNLSGASEFLLESAVTNVLQIMVGGTNFNLLSVAQGYEANKRYRIKLVGTTITVWKTLIGDLDTPILTTSFTRGATREAAALTVLGAAVNNTAGTYVRFTQGIQFDVKIGGILWPIATYNAMSQNPTSGTNVLTISNATSANWIEA